MLPFLFELGLEEIPARMMRKAAKDLKKGLEEKLKDAGLAHQGLEAHATPRSLVIWSQGIQASQEDRNETVKGPPVKIAYKPDGTPSPALNGFLRKFPEVDVKDLTTIAEPKGDVVAFSSFVKGEKAADLLARMIPEILNGLHFAKNMRWGKGELSFVRPVHSMVALFGTEVIPFTFGDIKTGRTSFGMRFHGEKSFDVQSIEDFLAKKQDLGMLLSHRERRAEIEKQIAAREKEIGFTIVPDEALLKEVSELVEQPYVVLGSFDQKFLSVPREVLISSLREHQKAFVLQDNSGKLAAYFLSVANVPGDPKGLIRKGNEWVLGARLYDAKFFWDSDTKKDLEALRSKLENLTFQNKLGSFLKKVERLETMADELAELFPEQADSSVLKKAAHHCKTDLMSELVFEFPELQGQVGGLLLQHAAENQVVADAIYDHYLPNSAEDDLPRGKEGAWLSILDKMDTLFGCFSIGLIPTGTKDPFALRRAAQGVIRILMECEIGVDLCQIIGLSQYADESGEVADQLFAFFKDRIRHLLKAQGFDHHQVEAVLAVDEKRPDLALKRCRALDLQMKKDHFRDLALNLKRMQNAIADEIDNLPTFQEELLSEDPEKKLWAQFEKVSSKIDQAIEAKHYDKAMDIMAELAEPVDKYFSKEGVFVNVDDATIRLNRKAMLYQMSQTTGQVANFTLL